MHHHIFAFFLQTVYAIDKLRSGFNVQPRIGMNQSLVWLHFNESFLIILCLYDTITSNAVYRLVLIKSN